MLALLTAQVTRVAKAWRRAPEVLACAREIVSWRRVTLAYLKLVELSYPFTIQFRNGDRIRVDSYHDLVTVWVIFLREEYRVGADLESVVDAGANIGAFTLYAARKAPSAFIHALEPFPSTRAQLLRTLQDNALTSRVRVHAAGLAGSDEPRFMSPEGPSQSRGTSSEPEGGQGIRVETVTLAAFITEAGISGNALLKVDIEGAEHEVLHATDASSLRRFREIALEYHPNGPRAALFAKLGECGFVCERERRDFEDSGVAQFVRVGRES